jgi:hypothetical protein
MSRLSRLGTIAMLPSKAVEELAHIIAAWPWARRIGVTIEPGNGGAATHAVLDDDTPAWGRWLVHHAPKIAGFVLAVAALGAVSSGVRPQQPIHVAGAVAMAAWWARLVAPEQQTDTEDKRDA